MAVASGSTTEVDSVDDVATDPDVTKTDGSAAVVTVYVGDLDATTTVVSAAAVVVTVASVTAVVVIGRAETTVAAPAETVVPDAVEGRVVASAVCCENDDPDQRDAVTADDAAIARRFPAERPRSAGVPRTRGRESSGWVSLEVSSGEA